MNDAAKKYLRDIRFWIPALMLLGLELFLQSGLYGRFMLEKYSYADSIRQNVRIVENSPIEPNALILGTSVAYQGLNIAELNSALAEQGSRIVTQSAACEGCMLQTQHLLYRVLKDQWPDTNTIIHVADTTLSSKARYEFDVANGSMMAQFSRSEALELLHMHEFKLTYREYLYFYIRLITNQQDLREFVLNPFRRIRTIGERLRTPLPDYTHVNDNLYSYGAFTATGTLADCARNALAGVQDQGQPVPEKKDGEEFDPTLHKTDRHHRNAVHVTCHIANLEKNHEPAGEAQWRKLYFRRVKTMYDEIYADGRRVITIIPPYSDLILHANTDERIERWRKNLAEINAGRDYEFIDMRRSLDSFDNPAGRKYFYDVLHLNAEGSIVWTRKVAERLRPYEPLILRDRDR
ncbi:MAG: SGNH/GDSL hydrolase family protein [bacterium]|nr:SGNH/GDSL hydrolase family protein [bacterium]